MENVWLTQPQLQCKWPFPFCADDSDRISIQSHWRMQSANAIQLKNIKILSWYKMQVNGKGIATMTRQCPFFLPFLSSINRDALIRTFCFFYYLFTSRKPYALAKCTILYRQQFGYSFSQMSTFMGILI